MNRKIGSPEIFPTRVVICLEATRGLPNKTSRQDKKDRMFTILPKVTKAGGRYSL
jgi:hypothetical protein